MVPYHSIHLTSRAVIHTVLTSGIKPGRKLDGKKETPKGGVGLGRVRKQLINKGIAFPLASEGRHMRYINHKPPDVCKILQGLKRSVASVVKEKAGVFYCALLWETQVLHASS